MFLKMAPIFDIILLKRMRGDPMSKTTNANPTKEKILLYAADIFLEHGYRDTTVRMIAEKAGINSALINYHYGNKETLYLDVVRYWAEDAFREYPFDLLDDPAVAPEEKVRRFIYHTLICLFGPDGNGTGFGRLLAHEAAISPSDVVHEIVSETIGRPTQALSHAVEQITGIHAPEILRIYTACIVGQTVYFYLSRNLTYELLDVPLIHGARDIQELSEMISAFSMAALKNLQQEK